MQQTTRRGFFAALAGAAVATQAPLAATQPSPLPLSGFAISRLFVEGRADPLDPADAAYALKCVNSMIERWNVQTLALWPNASCPANSGDRPGELALRVRFDPARLPA